MRLSRWSLEGPRAFGILGSPVWAKGAFDGQVTGGNHLSLPPLADCLGVMVGLNPTVPSPQLPGCKWTLAAIAKTETWDCSRVPSSLPCVPQLLVRTQAPSSCDLLVYWGRTSEETDGLPWSVSPLSTRIPPPPL